jgi:hypothetical protein
MKAVRGLDVDHTTIIHRVQRCGPDIDKKIVTCELIPAYAQGIGHTINVIEPGGNKCNL